MGKTNISWANKSLNFYNWYCTKVSAGCKNCYMFSMRKQFGREDTELKWRSNAMKEYDKLNPGEVVFVNSMSDTYHEDALFIWQREIHKLVAEKPEVTFLLLTKRPHFIDDQLIWPPNLWLGVSVENCQELWRIDALRKIPVHENNRFISAEPLLEDLTTRNFPFNLRDYYGRFGNIGWMIVGAESGVHRRPFDKDWALKLLEFCHATGTHFTFKQGSNRFPGKDCELEGNTYLSTPFTAQEKIE